MSFKNIPLKSKLVSISLSEYFCSCGLKWL